MALDMTEVRDLNLYTHELVHTLPISSFCARDRVRDKSCDRKNSGPVEANVEHMPLGRRVRFVLEGCIEAC